MAMSLQGIAHWERPLRSPGSTSNDHRLVIRGYLTSTVGTQLQVDTLVSSLVRHDSLQDCFISCSGLSNDTEALLVDFNSPAALLPARGLCSMVMLLSPTRALVRTPAPAQTWAQILTAGVQSTPTCCIQRLRWRPSVRAGRTWVKPHVLDRDARSAAARARPRQHTRADPQGLLTVFLRGPLGPQSDALLQALVSALLQHTGAEAEHGSPNRVLQADQWAEMREADGTWNGGIRFQFRSKEQALSFATQARSYAVVLGDLTTCLDVHSPYLPEWLTALSADPRLGFRVVKANPASG